jgi:hypothetical protein
VTDSERSSAVLHSGAKTCYLFEMTGIKHGPPEFTGMKEQTSNRSAAAISFSVVS